MLPTLLASLLLFGATPGQEQQAAALFHQSVTEFELGNFDAALGDISKAYRLDPRPELLFNLGQCHRALHHWERAAFFYGEYLHKTPSASNRAFVEGLIAEMESKQQAEAASAGGKPGEVVLVEAPKATTPPPVAPPSVPAEAPFAAEPFPSPAPARSHTLGIGLLSTGLASGVLTGVAALEIVHYNGAYAGAANQSHTLQYTASVSQAQSQAGVWQVVEIVSAVLGVAGVGTAAFVW